MEHDLQAVITDGAGRRFATLRELDLADPLTAGIARQREGVAPAADDQVAISHSLADHLGKGVGDSISARLLSYGPVPGTAETGATAKTLRISGIYDGDDDLYADQVFVRHGTFQGGSQPNPEQYFVALPGGVDWSLVQKLNTAGFTVESKKVVSDPPARSQMPYYTANSDVFDSGGGVRAATVAVVAIALAMVLLEVVLLAGPAFAVSARRRRRDFGLLGAAGADGRRLRRIVLADGVVLGLAGGVAGTVLGVVAGAVTLPLFAHLSQQNPGGFRIVPEELLGAAAVGVLTGLAAALAPAIVTARQDVLAALTGRRGQVRTPWRMSVVGLVGLGVGTALILGGSLTGTHTWPVAAGIALAELGVVACTPLLVSWFGRLGRVLPLTGRLAVRDGARNRGRTAPAVAAIMARWPGRRRSP
ncbi:FtsX-like permease family protein [Catenulispora yoronensis]